MEIGNLTFLSVFIAALAITLLIVSLKAKTYTNVKVGGYVVRAEVADNFLKQMNGLMGRGSLAENEGMLFAFPTEGYYGFWMMNMSMPIDIVFISKDKAVVDVVRNAQPCGLSQGPCISMKPKEKAMYVLEVKANFTQRHGVKVGALADFTLSQE
jgi:uncharacterized protein